MQAITVRVDEDTLRRIDELAGAMDRPRSWIVTDALCRYLEEEDQWLQKIRKGMAELDRGEGIPRAQVMDAMRNRIAGRRK